jgi:hypothetical protein
MRRLAFTFLLFLALAVPVAATADVPPAAVAACQAEYAQLGADAFAAKYGPTEPWGHCYAAHTTTTTPPPPPTTTATTDNPAAAACKAEYLQLGPAAFAAKYGTPETYGNCVKAHTTSPDAPPPTTTTATTATTASDNAAVAACKAEYLKLGGDAFAAKYGGKEALGQCVKLHTAPPTTGDAATSVATAFCQALAKALGKDAFLAKFGPKEALGTCVRASLANAKALVASCKASSGSSKDAFKACLAAGLQPQRR